MNDFMNNPFMQNMQQEEDRYLTEVHPLAKLWALRILVELVVRKNLSMIIVLVINGLLNI